MTIKCNKTQSITFLMDESGGIGGPEFNMSLDFLELYINQTYDDFSLMSIQYFSGPFRAGVPFGSTYDDLLLDVTTSGYAAGSTWTGDAMKDSVDQIIAQNFPNGLPKILCIMTDGDPNGGALNIDQGYQYA